MSPGSGEVSTHDRSQRGGEILYVVPNEADYTLARVLLEEKRLTIHHAHTGISALEQLARADPASLPDLIMVSYLLPMMTADEFIAQVRILEHVRHIPIVVVGGPITPEELQTLYFAGANYVLSLSSDLAECERAFSEIQHLCASSMGRGQAAQ